MQNDEISESLNLAINNIFKCFNPYPEEVVSLLAISIIGISNNLVHISDRRVLVKKINKIIKDNVITLNGN